MNAFLKCTVIGVIGYRVCVFLDLADQITLSLIAGAFLAVPLFLVLSIAWLCIPRYRRRLITSRILLHRPKISSDCEPYDY